MKSYLHRIDRDTTGNRYDVTPLFAHYEDLSSLVRDLVALVDSVEIDLVAGIDALGFILGTAVAYQLKVGFLPIRKGGKLPVPVHRAAFRDYTDQDKQLEIRQDVLSPGARVLLVDEWIETGAQVSAAIHLIEGRGGMVVGIATINADDNECTASIRSRYPVYSVWEKPAGVREGAIRRRGHTVLRPLHPWSSTIHLLLNHLRGQGFTECPAFLGIEGDCEVLSFIEGDTYNYPLTGAISTADALVSAARLLRRLHDASQDFLPLHKASSTKWMLPAQEPPEVVCHGDFAPYNVALDGTSVAGVFDFDAAHPAPRIWDLAYSVYAWSPFKTHAADAMGSLEGQIERARLFCDSYALSAPERRRLVPAMIRRLRALIDFMRTQAEAGNEKFQRDIEHGHHLGYAADIEYLRAHAESITLGLLEKPG